VLAAQPLAVEQVGTGEFGPEPTAAEPVDRLLVAAISLKPQPAHTHQRSADRNRNDVTLMRL